MAIAPPPIEAVEREAIKSGYRILVPPGPGPEKPCPPSACRRRFQAEPSVSEIEERVHLGLVVHPVIKERVTNQVLERLILRTAEQTVVTHVSHLIVRLVPRAGAVLDLRVHGVMRVGVHVD